MPGKVLESIELTAAPQGGAAGIFASTSVQKSSVALSHTGLPVFNKKLPAKAAPLVLCKEVATHLAKGTSLIWAGFGGRDSAEILTQIAVDTRTPVICTLRAKGIFPENHELSIGSTGLGSNPVRLAQAISNQSIKCVIILGSRLGEFSSS